MPFPITDPTWIFFVVLSIILFAPMLLERLRIPAIVGMIFAGIIIGPHGLHVLDYDGSFALFGKVGLYYIMFLASLEMNLQDVQKIRGQALLFGLMSFAIPILIGFCANSWLLGYGVTAAILMAAMYASHTLISYPIVMRYGIARERGVSLAVGGTIVADTLTLLVLAVVGGMFKENVTGHYWIVLMLKVVVIGLFMVYTFPRVCRWFFRRYDDGVVQYIFVLALVFLGAGLMEIVGMEGILGAFLVGLVLNRSIPPNSPLMNQIEFVGNALFIPYFLIGVGMIINIGAMFSHSSGAIVAVVMIIVGTLGKWLAALGAQKMLHMGADERRLMFGLTGARAAATLAIVLVGYDIIQEDGSHLFDEDVLNGTMLLILATCIISSFTTERAARSIVLKGSVSRQQHAADDDRIVVALSNPNTVMPLITAALMMRTPKAASQLTAVSVIIEDDPAIRERSMKILEQAAKIAAAANIRLQTHCRWSVNPVTGITHSAKEFQASDVLIGLHQKERISDTFFGKFTSDLLAALPQQVIIYRSIVPINTVRHIHLVVPRKAEFDTGFVLWTDRVAQLAEQICCRMTVYSGKLTLQSVGDIWKERHPNAQAEFSEYSDWNDFLAIAHRMRQDHLILFISAHHGMPSFHHYLDHLPEQIERYFSTRSLIIIYPAQSGGAARTRSEAALRSGGITMNMRRPAK